MSKYLLILLMVSFPIFSQDYFPLEIGNRWDYERTEWGGDKDTFSVKVIGDTLMPNGQTYFVLNREMGPGRFLYADSNYIYYYDESDSADTPIYDLNAELDQWYRVGMNSIELDSPRVKLSYIDTTDYFGVSTRILVFEYDWLTPFRLSLSDKFGPVHHYTAHFTPYFTEVFGCNISNAIYGSLVSVEFSENQIENFSLNQNYPNPFNPKTNIRFEIPQRSNVILSIFSVNGERLFDLVNSELERGSYEYELDGSSLSSGIYFYQLKTDDYIQTKKLVLLK